MLKKFIRTKKDGCFALSNNKLWGPYYIPYHDPEGEDTPDYIEDHYLDPNFAKLPNDLFNKIFTLFNAFDNKSMEVQVVLGRAQSDIRRWTAFVPEQHNTLTSVNANLLNMVNIETGEESSGLPTQYIYAGTKHLHPNNMGAFWSTTDDTSELKNPGMHCTISKTSGNKFNICASICLKGNRYVYKPSDLIELEGEEIVKVSKKYKGYVGEEEKYFYTSPKTVEKIPLKCFELVKAAVLVPKKHYGGVTTKATTGYAHVNYGAWSGLDNVWSSNDTLYYDLYEFIGKHKDTVSKEVIDELYQILETNETNGKLNKASTSIKEDDYYDPFFWQDDLVLYQ